MEYSDFDCECNQMPNNMMGYGPEMMQCPYMRKFYSRNNYYQCPFAEDFERGYSYDYEMPFLMPRIVSVDLDELF